LGQGITSWQRFDKKMLLSVECGQQLRGGNEALTDYM